MATRKPKKRGGRQRKMRRNNARTSTKQEIAHAPGVDEEPLERDAVVRGSIHASPRAWLELISSLPLEKFSLERLDTQGTLINRRPDALYRVCNSGREWIYCVEAQSSSDGDMGRRFLIALVMLLTEALSTKSRPGFVPLELRINERSRALNPSIPYRWGPQDLRLSWICSNALLERDGKVAELPLTPETVTIHAWHVGTTKARIEDLCDWIEAQDVEEEEKSLILCLLRLTSRVRFGVEVRRIPIFEECAAMIQAKMDKRADESVYQYLVRELETQALEREEKRREEGRLEGRQEGRLEGRQEGRLEGRLEGRQEGRQEGRLEGREEGRHALLTLAERVLPHKIDALRRVQELDALRDAVHVAIAELALRSSEGPSSDD